MRRTITILIGLLAICIQMNAQSTLKEGMEMLRQQYGISYIYDSSLPILGRYNGDRLNAGTLQENLSRLFHGSGIDYIKIYEANRDVIGEEETERFLRGTLEDLYDPRKLPDAEKAVSIIVSKIGEGKRIRIIGDYDVDGICASYILWYTLRSFGNQADCVLPDRMRDGYGINERLVREAYGEGVDTIVTCDNGIAASEPLAVAKELGMTVVVTDHHEVPFRVEEDGHKEYIL